MYEDRLRQLHQLLPRVEANAERKHADADEADALVRDTRTEIVKATRERRHLRPLTFIPGGFGVAAALKAWHARPRVATLAAAGGSATIVAAGAIALAVIVTPGGQPPLATGPALPSVEPLPPAGHWPPPIGPPKGRRPKSLPPTPLVVVASPTALSVLPSPGVSAGPPLPNKVNPPEVKPPEVKPPEPPHVPPVEPPELPPPVDEPPPEGGHGCVVDLLGVGLLCDRAVIAGGSTGYVT